MEKKKEVKAIHKKRMPTSAAIKISFRAEYFFNPITSFCRIIHVFSAVVSPQTPLTDFILLYHILCTMSRNREENQKNRKENRVSFPFAKFLPEKQEKADCNGKNQYILGHRKPLIFLRRPCPKPFHRFCTEINFRISLGKLV